MCLKKEYKYVFMDINMPIMNGFISAQLMKKLKNPPYLIALSGNDEEKDKEKCFINGFDVFIPKPLDFNSVCDLIKM